MVIRLQSIHRLLALCLVIAALAIASPAIAAEAEYAVVLKKTKTIRGVYHFVVHAPQSSANTWVVVAAQVPQLPWQTGTLSRLLPAGQPIADLTDPEQLLLRAVIPADGAQRHELRGQIEWQATLHSRDLVRREKGGRYPPAQRLSQLERQLALSETPTLDFGSETFGHWLRAHHLYRQLGENELDFARRAFLTIRKLYRYEFASEMDRHASFICQHDRADCGGMSNMLVSTLRANKIPAHTLCGRWAKSSKAGQTLDGVPYNQQHVKSEFFIDGIGWIPTDVTRSVTADKSPEGLRWFGHEGGDFLTIHVDPDLEFDTGLFGVKTLPLLQSFHYYARGEGKFSNLSVDSSWVVEELR